MRCWILPPRLSAYWISLLTQITRLQLNEITPSLPSSPLSFSSPSPPPLLSFLLLHLHYPFLSLVLPPSFYLDMPLPFAAGLHSHFVGSPHLRACPLTFYFMAAWTTVCPSLLSSSPCIKLTRRWDYYHPPPHVCSDFGPLHMLLHCEVMHSLSVSALFGSFDRFRILQEVVSGIEGGQLHGIP